MLPLSTDFGTTRGTRKPMVVLTIAGFDPSSGAGVSADLQTFAAHGHFGVACIAALTVQSTRGVQRCEPVAPALVGQTLRTLDSDFQIAGVKIGMLGDAASAVAVAVWLASRSRRVPVVVDPVLRSSSGAELLSPEGLTVLMAELLPLADWMTPNRLELAILGGVQELRMRYPEIVIVETGGDEEATDRLHVPGLPPQDFRGNIVATTSTHGTGCAFSSSLMANLVAGAKPAEAVSAAKLFVEGALRFAPGLGHGRGPMDLLWPLRSATEQ